MEILLWGVRGSIASPSQETLFYGNNTPCIEMRAADGTLLIFDAGSGLHLLGQSLPASGECHLFLTHGHMDHIQGLGFFMPLRTPAWLTHIYLPEELAHLPESLFSGGMFPAPLQGLQGRLQKHLLAPHSQTRINAPGGPIMVEALPANHPGGNMAYRVNADDVVVLYTGDHEITGSPESIEQSKAMLRGTTLALVDAAYAQRDYTHGWGHSTWESWVSLAAESAPGSMVFLHHLPGRTDNELDALQQTLQEQESVTGCPLYVAREGMRLTPPERPMLAMMHSDWLNEFLRTLAQYKDESAILDRFLAKAREITGADAGTVFLEEDGELVFAYTHNDTFFHVDSAYKYAYANMRIPIAESSIAGYAAATGKALNIPDVQTLPQDAPYRFNQHFDAKTGYLTQSMLAIPFLGRNQEVLGVLQLLNSLRPGSKTPQAFSPGMEHTVKALAREAGKFLEFGVLLRQNIYRMLHITAIHDPQETGQHAERVGAITAEIYQRWAERKHKTPENIRFVKSQIRLAAMLHDIGKVGITDLILKKPGKLTQGEFAVMRTHAPIGGHLLASSAEDITDLAHEIALHHHQKWDGTGYAGAGEEGQLAGEAIPLTARLTAVADVFDALVSPRCYKEPWRFDDALGFIKQEAGTHFDPLVVDCFAEITDIVQMIYARFPDQPPVSGVHSKLLS